MTRTEIEAQIAELNYLIAREERIAHHMFSMGRANYGTAIDGCTKRIERMQTEVAALKAQYDNTLPDPPEEVEVNWNTDLDDFDF